MVSLKDIAEACGVSVATVSKALNNHSDVSQSRREQIKKKANEHRRNSLAVFSEK